MALKKNDFIELEYTARLKDDNSVFDTTSEETAKKEGIYEKEHKFGPVIICLGQGQLVKGLDTGIIGKDVGKYTISLGPEQAFGKKSAKMLQMVNTNVFLKQKLRPFPGLQVNIDGIMGTIRTVTGGRTIVDFNHPLAGKDVVYEIEIKRQVTEQPEQLKAFLSTTLGVDKDKIGITIAEGKAAVVLPEELPKAAADSLKDRIMEIMGLKDISFSKEQKI